MAGVNEKKDDDDDMTWRLAQNNELTATLAYIYIIPRIMISNRIFRVVETRNSPRDGKMCKNER